MRKLLAWESILDQKDTLDLSPHQVKQAETQMTAADGTVTARLPETYQWLLVPMQENPQAPVTWQTVRLSGSDALAERASKKLKNDESLVVSFAASRLRMEMDRVPLWRGNHVAIRQLVDDFGRYLYLPRLQTTTVLLNAIRSGLALPNWERDAFAYAENYDEPAGRYQGLRVGAMENITADDTGLLVRSEVARPQIDQESADDKDDADDSDDADDNGDNDTHTKRKRYHGTVALDPTRVGRDAGRIADEIVSHLVGLIDSSVHVTLEIAAEIPGGTPDNVIRTVTENSRTLKFASSGFETE